MAIISICSPKGGVGKATAATLIATTLAERGAGVIVIDADPNKSVVDWARLPGVPANLKVLESTDENEIVRMIDASAAEADFVIVDLEGRASPIVGHAIAMSNFVIVPARGSNLDAKQAARQMAMIKTQERLTGRAIPFAVLFTCTNPALQPKTQRFIEASFAEAGVPIFSTQLFDREAFRAVFSFGGTLSGLKARRVSNVQSAIANARALTDELLHRIKNGNRPVEEAA